MTVMHCVFADGTFERPMVIGKANNPRCFKSIDKQSLPVTWKFNRKAWMTASVIASKKLVDVKKLQSYENFDVEIEIFFQLS